MQQPSLVECLYHWVILLRLVLIELCDGTILVADVVRYPHGNHAILVAAVIRYPYGNHAHAKIASLLIAKLRN